MSYYESLFHMKIDHYNINFVQYVNDSQVINCCKNPLRFRLNIRNLSFSIIIMLLLLAVITKQLCLTDQ